MSEDSKIPTAFDYEGPLANPAIDFAWMIFNELVSTNTKKRFTKERIEEFDSYDDARWEHERNSQGHSTGTTPLICDYVAIIDGVTDPQLVDLAKRKVKLNKGVDDLVRNLFESSPFYIVTNSHPALSLVTAEQYGIPFKNVFTHGRQLTDKQHTASLQDEVIARSPLSALSSYRGELPNPLDKYLRVCAEMLKAINQNNSSALNEARRRHDELFSQLSPNIRGELEYQLLQENAITGGHNKAKILRRIAPDGNIIYVGDSIVDADAIAFARYGFSVNCTNSHALRDSKLNIVTTNMGLMQPIFDDIQSRRFSTRGIKQRYSGLQIFTPSDIRDNFDSVKAANSEVKSGLKKAYSK